ncbi:MAG TPA: transaldolase family protein [Candidatus Baltobacteraceae bacterium]|nr:transaldolase family protein [Candidatus Baltobacteraceae bacterium]
MGTGYFQRVHTETPTRFWVNNPSQSDTEQAIAAGAVACTTNPSYCAKLLQSEPAYIRGVIDRVVQEVKDNDEAAERVYHEASARIMRMFLPVYEQSQRTLGFVTIQDDPRADDDTEHIVDVTMRCCKLGPNFMTKIPVIESGMAAIEELVTRNIPICATEVFGVAQAVAMAEAYERAAKKSGHRPPFYLTHITGIFDQYMAETVKAERIAIAPAILQQAGCILARRQYAVIKQRFPAMIMLGGGARGTYHFTEFVGGAMHITINWSTAEELIAANPPVASRIDAPTPAEVVHELRAKVPGFRRAYDDDGLAAKEFKDFGPLMYFRAMFLNGYARLLDEVAERRS